MVSLRQFGFNFIAPWGDSWVVSWRFNSCSAEFDIFETLAGMDKDCVKMRKRELDQFVKEREGFGPGSCLLSDHWSSTCEHLTVVADVAECHSYSLSPLPLHVWVWYLFSECAHPPDGAWILFLKGKTRNDCACTVTITLASSSLGKGKRRCRLMLCWPGETRISCVQRVDFGVSSLS